MATPKKKTPAKAPKPPRKKKAERIVVPTPKDYVRDLRAMKDVERGDYAFMSDPIAWTSTVTEWLSTGILALDRLTGGGWPITRIIELAAWENVGKTTVLDQSIAQAQRDGAVCALIDSEQARDINYTAALGVDVDKLIIHKAETVEECFEGIDRVLSIQEAYIKKLTAKKLEPPPMLIAWDSIAGTPTAAELTGAADDKHVAGAAKSVRMNIRRLAQRIAKARACLVFTNHFYENIGPFGGLKTYGGGGIRYGTSLRVWMSRTGTLKGPGKVDVGQKIEAKLKKTRIAKPRPPAELGLIWGAGVHNAYTLYEWGKTAGVEGPHRWVIQKGSWSYLMMPDGTHEAWQGSFVPFADVLKAHPAIYAQMAEQYRNEG